MANILDNIISIPGLISFLKIGLVGFVLLILFGVGFYYVMVIMRQRKWTVEVHEQKADGRLHTIGRDTLIEKRLDWGRKTIYWLKKARQEVIPPPWETVDRFKGKEEVDYIRVEREFIPAQKTLSINTHAPEFRRKLGEMEKKILDDIHKTDTKIDKNAVANKWIHVPIEKTLRMKVDYHPIPYDMNMMAMNEIHNADEFFKSKYEFWKKYGAVIVFGLTIIFLIIVIVLTYDWIATQIQQIVGAINTLATNTAQGAGGAPPPA